MLNTNIFPQIVSVAYSLLIIVAFFSKKKITSVENNIFGLLLVGNLVGLFLDVLAYFFVINIGVESFLTVLICRFILIYLVLWIFTMTVYIYAISNKVSYNDKKANNIVWQKYLKFKRIIVVSEIIFVFLVSGLPLDIISNNGDYYSTGIATYVIYVVSSLLILVWVFIILKNKENIRNKKFYPMYIYMALGAVSSFFQFNYPQMIIITPIETFVTILMYFTIENPDLKMLNELYKNRELMEAIYEDKYNFLFEMTQEARNPIKEISRVCNEIKTIDNEEEIKEGIDRLSTLTRQLDFSVNNVLDISSLDIQKIKIVNTKYDIIKICEALEVNVNAEKNDDVKYNVELPKQVPILYGDYMKIRQILYSLLMNACKKTTNGSINLKLNAIEKYDVCRLIFNISDTGPGMGIDIINDILSATGELDKEELDNLERKECNVIVCKKIAKIMGGNLMVKSDPGKGTDIVLTIDQRVFHEEDSVLNQYKQSIENYKKVLIVSQNKRLINDIKKKLNDKDIVSSSLYFGGDAVDKIRSGKKYDFILIDDDMKMMSGYETFNKLRKLKGFNIPVVIMLKEEKEHIKKHYIEDGFGDYLLENNLNSELNRIIEKY